jgi:tetratricopeptide (TPR) repeat protein
MNNDKQLAWLESNHVFDKDAAAPPVRNVHVKKIKKKARGSRKIEEPSADSEIDLHGLNLEEALCKVGLELELAKNNNWKLLRIVHGIGEKSGGIIRKALEKKFRSEWSNRVSEYRYERNNRGSSLAVLRNSLTLILALAMVQVAYAGAETALQHIYKTEYSKAFAEISNIPKEDSSSCVLKGIAFVSRYDDLGDTLDLDSALFALEKCKARDLWEPLRRYEIGLINSILGNTIKGIRETREAALIFAEKEDMNAKAFYAIYGYYAEMLTNWLPFVESKREIYLANLKIGFEHSRLFSPIFGNTLIWMFYDNKKYNSALNVVNSLLAQYPNHPVISQTKADMLYRAGRAQEAISMYKQSEALYAKRAPNSIRYWCAVVNLSKMTDEPIWKKKLQSKEYSLIKRWMPEGI